MNKTRTCLLGVALMAALSSSLFAQLSDVTQPGDPMIPSSANNPGSEAVANAIDNQPTKFLNFDSGRDGTNAGFSPSGFVVSPSVGITYVTGIAMQSANDAPERDPKTITLEGSNDAAVTNFSSGNWTLIVGITNITPWPTLFPGNDRFQRQTLTFPNARPYKHYRWIVHETQTTPNGCCLQIAEVEFLGTLLPQDVTQPGDTIIPSSGNSPGSEAVANAIDNQPTKYLNFDGGRDGTNAGFSPSGFVVSPSIGRTLVTGISMQSANDGPERDPKDITLEGSNDTNLTAFASGTWELITAISNIPSWQTTFPGNDRFRTQTFMFDNFKPYRHYRWVVNKTQTTPNGCCLQIAEVELLGTGAPQDVTQPGDTIIPSSANNPGSEAVANIIDNQPTKYLNFDSGRDGTNAGFSPSGFAVTPGIGPTTVIGLTMQSANDAPERDPKTVTLEGSNDTNLNSFASGTWELITGLTNITSWPTLFPGNDRFRVQEFFFPNKKAFKHYRWIVYETQTTPNGCCLQIAEVELLAVTAGGSTNAVEGLIRRQPVDVPVLLGAQATFRIFLTGPWNVQWYRNGVRVPGAATATYTTPAAVQSDDGAIYTAVVQSPQGQQTSDEVMLSIFTPSTIESIAVSWPGAGANGAPTAVLPADITGFQPQAYWNSVAPGGTGSTNSLVNSSNQIHPTVQVQWATSGEWGVGTGTGDATERMLNGLIAARVSTEATAVSVTLSGVPAGNHTLLLYTVQVPLEFWNEDFIVATYDAGGAEKAAQRRYIRPQNSDEYNPSPGFILVSSDTAASRSVGNMMRFDNLQPENGQIQIRFYAPGRTSGQGPGLNGMQLVLNPPPVVAPPLITQEPVSANGILGGQATLTVETTGPDLTYQWLKAGKEIQGATEPKLTLSNLSTNDSGTYSVAISNPAGRILSRKVVVAVLQTVYVTEGLINYFKFDEVDVDTIITNSVAGGQNGAARGAFPGREPGQIGNALVLDQASSVYGFVTNYTKPSQSMTISGWIASTDGQLGPLINSWMAGQPTGASGQFQMEVAPDAANIRSNLVGQIEVGPNKVRTSGSIDVTFDEFPPYIFHHFAMTANGLTLSIYWDGALVGSIDYLGSVNAGPFSWLSMGANLTGDPVNTPGTALVGTTLKGLLDDIALWNRSLSADEIAAVYVAGLAGIGVGGVPPILTPPVDIARTPAGIVISWPPELTSFILESTPSLGGTPVWTPVPGVVNNSITIVDPVGNAFFRLKKL